ncbi:peptidylprolyl isomerase [Neptunicoccus cionae]|uniref:peptidylprolyl isomerase n=1 Tax=Neptunicoccus cionae TaxID=2035344 RepID=UPI000C75E1AC|nr:peptidylprolyl isomerase [Amylibacter cionae]PLS22806.1 peptidylprolyl isomerase [Amylibacter cionae]
MKFTRLIAASSVTVMMATVAPAQEEPTAQTVLATVNGKDITVGHVIALTRRLPERFQQLEDKDLYQGVLDQLIQQTALASDVDTTKKSIQIAIENETRALLASETLTKIEDEATTDALVQAAYDEAYADAPAAMEYKASHILVETEEEAKDLVKALNDGADFAETAKENSTGPSGPNGGDLGWMAKGRTVPEFENAMIALEPGEVSEPVKSQFGWHIIKLAETREAPKPTLEEVREQLVDQMKTQAVAEHMQTIEDSAEINRVEIDLDPAIIRNTDLLDK